MKKYSIVYSQEANDDINELYDFIIYEYKAYRTAEKYVLALENVIKELSVNAETFQIQTNSYFSRYGNCVRRVNFQKMVIIYTVEGNVIRILRVMPQSMIID